MHTARDRGGDIAAATSAIYTTPVTILADDGSQFQCVVTNGQGNATSNPATLNVLPVTTVTVTATDAAADELGDTGTFTVTRAGNTSGDLTVNIIVGGSATEGTDYGAVGTSVAIPAASASTTISDWNTGVAVAVGTWVHNAVTYDGATLTWYLDATPVGSSGPACNTADTVVIVGSPNTGMFPEYFDGLLDDVRIYDRVLAPAEITDVYNAGASGGLVGHWKLDHDGTDLQAIDSSGNANDGTLLNMTGTEWTTGQVDGALQFDGIDDYVDCNSGILPDTAADMTEAAWIRTTTADRAILTRRHLGGGWPSLMVQNTGMAAISVDDSGYRNDIAGTTTVTDGAWHHVVGVKQGTTYSIYVDGQMENSGTDGRVLTSTDNFHVGHLLAGRSGRRIADTLNGIRRRARRHGFRLVLGLPRWDMREKPEEVDAVIPEPFDRDRLFRALDELLSR